MSLPDIVRISLKWTFLYLSQTESLRSFADVNIYVHIFYLTSYWNVKPKVEEHFDRKSLKVEM